MDKDGSGVRSERSAETRDVREMEISRAGDIIDVRLKRQCAIEDDTQTLNLRGGRDSRVVDRNGETVRFGESGWGAY